ncbi:hydroxymethylbilane synthase [Aurantimicrobium minutum]|uniref:hydroxymethylbilane synthase n=1 Tax=Aurantimicrobium minutum TaxID=708131 RepID=UPI002476609B|nr:hydroxymethylbilane synthase [Aurantimicrobium minutum]MDH6423558.1 hydroxymethylbilane synthase [Aurantimicrobium minutum]
MAKLRVGTRGSLLALTQTRLFISQLCEKHPDLAVEEVLIQTQGDISTEPLNQSKTPGLFVSALRDALLSHEVDFIVHSMKDLPAQPFPGIDTACIPVREDSRDGFVSRGNIPLMQLHAGAVVGTSSPRRAARIRQLRPDLTVDSIRGNIDTRIAKVKQGEFDATLLAMAGLNRIGRAEEACEIFDNNDFIPAAGQGALSIECRSEDSEIRELLAVLDDKKTRLLVAAERHVLVGLDAGCATAIGAWATWDQGILTLCAELSVESSGEAQRAELSAFLEIEDWAQASQLGLEIASRLKASPISERVAWK